LRSRAVICASDAWDRNRRRSSSSTAITRLGPNGLEFLVRYSNRERTRSIAVETECSLREVEDHCPAALPVNEAADRKICEATGHWMDWMLAVAQASCLCSDGANCGNRPSQVSWTWLRHRPSFNSQRSSRYLQLHPPQHCHTLGAARAKDSRALARASISSNLGYGLRLTS
jgi:hypothetical protein